MCLLMVTMSDEWRRDRRRERSEGQEQPRRCMKDIVMVAVAVLIMRRVVAAAQFVLIYLMCMSIKWEIRHVANMKH